MRSFDKTQFLKLNRISHQNKVKIEFLLQISDSIHDQVKLAYKLLDNESNAAFKQHQNWVSFDLISPSDSAK